MKTRNSPRSTMPTAQSSTLPANISIVATNSNIAQQKEAGQPTRSRAELEETPSSLFGNSALAQADQSSITIPIEAVSKLLAKFRNEDKTIPTFYGSVLDWPLFIKKYRDTTKEFEITDDANQKRLDKALKGEARELVHTFLHNACLVDDVIGLLEAAYGGEENVVGAVTEAVKNMNMLQTDLKNVIPFTIEIKKVQLMLKQCNSPGREILWRIVKLLPLTERRMWALYLKNVDKTKSATIDDFMRWLWELKAQCKVTGIHEEIRHGQRRRPGQLYQNYEMDWVNKKHNAVNYERRIRKNYHGLDAMDYNDDMQQHQAHNYATRRPSIPRIMTNRIEDKGCVIMGCNDEHQFTDCPKFKFASQPVRFHLIRKYLRCPVCCGKHSFKQCPANRQ